MQFPYSHTAYTTIIKCRNMPRTNAIHYGVLFSPRMWVTAAVGWSDNPISSSFSDAVTWFHVHTPHIARSRRDIHAVQAREYCEIWLHLWAHKRSTIYTIWPVRTRQLNETSRRDELLSPDGRVLHLSPVLIISLAYCPNGRDDNSASIICVRYVSVQIFPPSWTMKIRSFWRSTFIVVSFCIFLRNFAQIGQSTVEL